MAFSGHRLQRASPLLEADIGAKEHVPHALRQRLDVDLGAELQGGGDGWGRGTGGVRSGYVVRPSVALSRLMRFPLAVALLVALAGALTGCDSSADVPSAFLDAGPEQLAELAVVVERPDDLVGVDSMFSRSAFLGDGRGTFFYDELARDQTDAAMGLIAGGFRVLDGWQWDFPLDTLTVRLTGRDRAAALARPDFVARTYAERDTSGFVGKLINRVSGRPLKRLTEQITLVDTLGVLLVHIPDSLGVVDFLPVVSDRAADEYEVRRIGGDGLALARRNYLIGDGARPVWLAVRTSSGEALTDADEVLPSTARERGYSFGRLRLQTPATIAIATANSDTLAAQHAATALRNADQLLGARQARMVGLLDETYVRTEDERFDSALAWARLSLDALVATDGEKAWMMPGIPGAVSTSGHAQMRAVGALLASGRWDQARTILATTTRAQRFDEQIDIMGRAPSSYTVTGEPLFETAEATPLFVGAWGDYIRATGETGLVMRSGLNLWFNTVFAGRGLYDNSRRHGRQVGPEGFLRAQGEETWMQAESRGRPVISRDGYPVEAQGALSAVPPHDDRLRRRDGPVPQRERQVVRRHAARARARPPRPLSHPRLPPRRPSHPRGPPRHGRAPERPLRPRRPPTRSEGRARRRAADGRGARVSVRREHAGAERFHLPPVPEREHAL